MRWALVLIACAFAGSCRPAETREARRQRLALAIVTLERAIATAGAEHRAQITKSDKRKSVPRLKSAEAAARAELEKLRALDIPAEDADLARYREARVRYVEDTLAFAARLRRFFTERKQAPDADALRARIKQGRAELTRLEASLPELAAARAKLPPPGVGGP